MTKAEQTAYLRTISTLLKLLPPETLERLLAEAVRVNGTQASKHFGFAWAVDQVRVWLR